LRLAPCAGASAPGAWRRGGLGAWRDTEPCTSVRGGGSIGLRRAACAVRRSFRSGARKNVSSCNRRAAGVSRRLNSEPPASAGGEPASRGRKPAVERQAASFSRRRRSTCVFSWLSPGSKPGARRTKINFFALGALRLVLAHKTRTKLAARHPSKPPGLHVSTPSPSSGSPGAEALAQVASRRARYASAFSGFSSGGGSNFGAEASWVVSSAGV